MEVTLDKTEKKIVEATLKLLENNSFSKTTTVKIAEKAGVSEVTIFRKFKSKENLMKTTKNYYLTYFLSQIDSIFHYDVDKNLRTLLKDIWWNLVDFVEDNMNIIQLAIDENRSTIDDKKILPTLFDKIVDNLTNIFQYEMNNGKIRDINPQIAALNVYSVTFQTLLMWKVYGKEPTLDFELYIDDFLDIFLKGIEA